MSGGVLDPAPFVRGAPWPAAGRITHPRADPADRDRLPRDTWNRACLPVGIRLEWVGTATEVVLRFTVADASLAFPWRTSTAFSVWSDGDEVASAPADLSAGRVVLRGLPAGGPVVVHPPEGVVAAVTAIEPVDGSLQPGPIGPRWLCYGDSVAEGWVASEASRAWPALVARRHGLDVVNLGYAGAARGEIPTAEQIARLRADVISLAYGTNCWTRTPHSAVMVAAGLDGFLDVVRHGHPATPIVVVSPIVRPDAEVTPNRLGATLADMRAAMEDVVARRVGSGDRLRLVAGAQLVDSELLADGVHPGDAGHDVMARALGEELVGALRGA